MITASQGRGPRSDPGGAALREALFISRVGRGGTADPAGPRPWPGVVRVDRGTAVGARPSLGTDDRHVSVSFAGMARASAGLDPLPPGAYGVP